MAAITVVSGSDNKEYQVLRNETAQATTGQTDWLNVPEFAENLMVYLNVTATAGTTPILTPAFLVADPVSRDDGHVVNLAEHAAFTGITDAAQVIFAIGPGVTGIANDVTNGATGDSWVSLNTPLPKLLGFQITNDRTTGDETYTYTLAVHFQRR